MLLAPLSLAQDLTVNAGDPLDGQTDDGSIYDNLTIQNAQYIGKNITASFFRANGDKAISVTESRFKAIGLYTTEESLVADSIISQDIGDSSSSATTRAAIVSGDFYQNNDVMAHLSNTHISVTSSNPDYSHMHVTGLTVHSGGHLVLDHGSSIVIDDTVNGTAIEVGHQNARVQADNVYLSVARTGDTNGVLKCFGTNDNSLVLTNSTIVSTDGNNLILFEDGSMPIVLDHVNLDRAQNQVIRVTSTGIPDITLKNGTHYHGYAVLADDSIPQAINMSLEQQAQWTLTAHSNLGVFLPEIEEMAPGYVYGHLFVDSTSCINFLEDGDGFFNINLVSIMLASGSILNLDKDSADEALSAGSTITLFTGASDSDFVNEGTLLISSDGYSLEYIDNNNGTFTLTGNRLNLIPEPSAALFGLFSLLSLSAARRRVNRQ